LINILRYRGANAKTCGTEFKAHLAVIHQNLELGLIPLRQQGKLSDGEILGANIFLILIIPSIIASWKLLLLNF